MIHPHYVVVIACLFSLAVSQSAPVGTNNNKSVVVSDKPDGIVVSFKLKHPMPKAAVEQAQQEVLRDLQAQPKKHGETPTKPHQETAEEAFLSGLPRSLRGKISLPKTTPKKNTKSSSSTPWVTSTNTGVTPPKPRYSSRHSLLKQLKKDNKKQDEEYKKMKHDILDNQSVLTQVRAERKAMYRRQEKNMLNVHREARTDIRYMNKEYQAFKAAGHHGPRAMAMKAARDKTKQHYKQEMHDVEVEAAAEDKYFEKEMKHLKKRLAARVVKKDKNDAEGLNVIYASEEVEEEPVVEEDPDTLELEATNVDSSMVRELKDIRKDEKSKQRREDFAAEKAEARAEALADWQLAETEGNLKEAEHDLAAACDEEDEACMFGRKTPYVCDENDENCERLEEGDVVADGEKVHTGKKKKGEMSSLLRKGKQVAEKAKGLFHFVYKYIKGGEDAIPDKVKKKLMHKKLEEADMAPTKYTTTGCEGHHCGGGSADPAVYDKAGEPLSNVEAEELVPDFVSKHEKKVRAAAADAADVERDAEPIKKAPASWVISVVKNKVDKAIDDALPTNTAEVAGPEEPSKKVLSPPPSEEAAPTELTEKSEGIEEIPATEAPAGSIDDDFQEKTSPAQMRWDLLKIILCLSSLCIALVWACASCIRTWERRQALKSVYQEISGYPNYRTAVNGKKYKARNAACTPPVEALTPEHSPRDLSVDQV